MNADDINGIKSVILELSKWAAIDEGIAEGNKPQGGGEIYEAVRKSAHDSAIIRASNYRKLASRLYEVLK